MTKPFHFSFLFLSLERTGTCTCISLVDELVWAWLLASQYGRGAFLLICSPFLDTDDSQDRVHAKEEALRVHPRVKVYQAKR